MTYAPNTWNPGDPITSAKLNNIEDGITAAPYVNVRTLSLAGATLSSATARYGAGSAVVNNKIYVIGGFTTVEVATNEEYDPATGLWTTKASMTAAKYFFGCAAAGGKVYCIGGRVGATGQTTNYEYDPAGNTWATKLATGTGRWGILAVANGTDIYLFGGGVAGTLYATNELYSTTGNTYTAKTALPGGVVQAPAGGLISGKIYVTGGFNGTGGTSPATRCDEYDIAGNSWTSKTAMPTARAYAGSAVVNGELYVLTGFDGATSNSVVEKYSPTGNSWATLPTAPANRHYACAEVVGNIIYLTCGIVGGSPSGSTLAFDPAIANGTRVATRNGIAVAYTSGASIKNWATGVTGTTIAFKTGERWGVTASSWSTSSIDAIETA